VDVDLNGVIVGRVFVAGQDCVAIEETLVVTAARLQLRQGRRRRVIGMVCQQLRELEAMPSAGPPIRVYVSYAGAPASADGNGNGVTGRVRVLARRRQLAITSVDFDDIRIRSCPPSSAKTLGGRLRRNPPLRLPPVNTPTSTAPWTSNDINPFVRCLGQHGCP